MDSINYDHMPDIILNQNFWLSNEIELSVVQHQGDS